MIYTDEMTNVFKERAGQKYRPGNGFASDRFMYKTCRFCRGKENCHVMALSMALDIEDEEYPPELIYGEDGWPACTAYVDE